MLTYLLYGEDTFSSKRKLEEIKSRFKDKNFGDINITVLDGEKINFEEIQKATSITPFLSQKRLLIIKNLLLKNKNEDFQKRLKKYLDKIPEYALVVFYEQGRPEKNSLFKKLNKPKKAQQFPLLSLLELRKWIEKEVKEKGGKIKKEAVFKLASLVGPDLWRMENEIEKLIVYKKKGEIKEEDVELLVKGKLAPSIFALIDALGQKDIKKAEKNLKELLLSGENESYILSMIAYQFRNLTTLKDLLQRGENPTSLGWHPFVLQKTEEQVKNFTLPQLYQIYDKLLKTDVDIKTGFLKPSLALDLLLAELCRC